ncbi:MAG: DUF1800 domain-containing protein, partial [Methylococcales bacterium]|nr:DUF1800 domain-containing protein [Methylococcales bacterium]
QRHRVQQMKQGNKKRPVLHPNLNPPNQRAAIPMHTQGKATVSPATNSQPPTVPLSIIALNRMGFGPRPGDIAAFNALGADDASRFSAYIAQQLDPDNIDDSVFDALVAGLGLTSINKTRGQLWDDHYENELWGIHALPMYELTALKWIRAIHSKKQLSEVLADFWHDHFNVYGWDFAPISMMPNYDRLIRDNMLGNFRTLLEEITKSACMLIYLDNAFNGEDGPNENFARELLELHTLGAENYLGSIAAQDVPGYPSAPIGYVENDVFEIAKCLTGWSLAYEYWDPEIGSTGLFLYKEDWHHQPAKEVIGLQIPANQADMQDGWDVLDLLATHPGTAQFVCRKLVRRLVADNPPQSLVDSAAAIFLAQSAAPDQLKQVTNHILSSSEFQTTWGAKFKRPFASIASALRAADSSFVFSYPDESSETFNWMYSQTGHEPYGWGPPNGFPDVTPFWQGTSTFLMRWRVLHWLTTSEDVSENLVFVNLQPQLPADVRSANAIVDFLLDRMLGYALDPATRTTLVEFMAQGFNPAFDLPLDTDEYIQTRLRGLVGLIFCTPEFQWR